MFDSILRNPDNICIETESGSTFFSAEENAIVGDVAVTVKDAVLSLTADKTAVKTVSFSWNTGLPVDAQFCGDHFERAYGDLEWTHYRHDRIYPWYVLCKAGETTAFYGVKTLPDSICHFRITPHCITLVCDCRCGADAVILSGRTITLAEVVCGEYDGIGVYETGRKACEKMVSAAVLPEKPVYGFNNWYYAYGESSRGEILELSSYLAKLTEGVENRPYMVIDDCWQKERPTGYIGGPWRESNEKFGDMQSLASAISADGNLPGIWIRPLQNKAPGITDEMYFDKSDFILDASRQDVLDYIAEDVKTIVGWGYRLIKHDYSTNDISGDWGMNMSSGFAVRSDCHFFDKSLTTAMIIKRLYKTIYEAAQGKAIIIGCNTIGHLGTGYFEINRTGDDTSGHDFERTRKMGVNALAFRMCQDGVFYKSDADCVGIMPEIDHKKNAMWLELLAKSGTPLFVSVAPDTLDADGNALLSEMLRASSEEHPQGIPEKMEFTACPEEWELFDGKHFFIW